MALTTGTNNQALLDAQLELWHTTFAYIKSMHGTQVCTGPRHRRRHPQPRWYCHPAPDSFQGHAHAPPVQDPLPASPHAGTHSHRHLQRRPPRRRWRRARLQAHAGVSALGWRLVKLDSFHVPGVAWDLRVPYSPFLGLGTWFQQEHSDPSLFEMTHGKTAWDLNKHNPAFGQLFNQGMVCDSSFIMDIIVKECGDIFRGLSSLIDVAGGLGGAAMAISTAFPDIQCSVLDLPHVAANAPASTSVKYIAGDMFESIPPADAVFLKWVLHDWGDADCIKILKNCKKAIPPRDAGGKVIILDMVIGGQSSNIKHKETQVLFDLFIMFVNGVERDEQEWKKIIFEAGFSDYKIIAVLGVRSIIEVYP